MSTVSVNVFLLMIRRPPRSTLTSTLLPTRRSSDLIVRPPLPLRARHLYGKAASYRWAPASMARPIPFPALSDACLSNECHADNRGPAHNDRMQRCWRTGSIHRRLHLRYHGIAESGAAFAPAIDNPQFYSSRRSEQCSSVSLEYRARCPCCLSFNSAPEPH